MMRILWLLAMSAGPTLVATAYAQETEMRVARTSDQFLVLMSEAGETDTGDVVVFIEDEGAPAVALWEANDAGAPPPPAPPAPPAVDRDRQRIRVERAERAAAMADREVARNQGWLGIAIGRVQAPLAAHLNIEERGIIVQNIVTGSPAEQAGLQIHDIILSIDGQDVGPETGQVIELLGSYKPGDTVNLMMLRGGINIPISVTLGSRSDMVRPPEWKIHVAPQAVIEDEIRTRGRMMHRGPRGRWMMKELGDLDEIEGLPEDIRAIVPRSGSRVIQIQSLADDNKVKVEVRRDGSSVVIKQEGDGPITVERTGTDGQTTTATYATVEELEQGDPEAHELYSQAGKAQSYSFRLDGLGDAEGVFEFDLDFNADEWRENLEEWQAKLEEGLSDELREQMKRQRELSEMMREKAEALRAELEEELRAKGWNGEVIPRPPLPPFAGEDGRRFFLRPFGEQGKPKHAFELRADGSIEVRIRRGDSELVQLYTSEEDLQRRSPDLYKKFDELMSLEGE
jgi:hypothetical protein